jgi:hypothetical protein
VSFSTSVGAVTFSNAATYPVDGRDFTARVELDSCCCCQQLPYAHRQHTQMISASDTALHIVAYEPEDLSTGQASSKVADHSRGVAFMSCCNVLTYSSRRHQHNKL